VKVGSDALGMVSLPLAPGRHAVELDHGVHLDFLAGLGIATLTGLIVVVRGLRADRRRP